MFGNPLLLADDGYQISRSVRLRSSASGNFTRTFTTPTSRRIFTFSSWLKRGQVGTNSFLFGRGTGPESYLTWISDSLEYYDYTGSAYSLRLVTSQVFRDPSAWYHIVLSVDTTQATASNRVKLYVNGIQVTAFSTSTYPSQNFDTNINTSATVYLGRAEFVSNYFDGYLTEINFIDGQALTPSSFGETDAITGVWKPKKYTGTYGTNGFFLNFSDNSSNTATTIGKDYSGNGNNWTPNNISVTAGSTYDSMLDVPTLWADGGNGRGNYCVLNPIFNPNGTVVTYSAANLQYSYSTPTGVANRATVQGSFALSSGKWYFEFTEGSPSNAQVGIGSGVLFGGNANGANYVFYYSGSWNVSSATTPSAPASFTNGDVIGVAFDVDNRTAQFFKNGVSQGTITAFESGLSWYPVVSVVTSASGGAGALNFGQRPFTYTPPTGFKALNTQNLPEPTIKKGNQYFDATLYTGTGSAQSIVNSGAMQPDLVWTKSRSASNDHILMDSVRGLSAALFSNLTNAEVTDSTRITSLNANGFTLGTSTSTNQNAATFVGWQWKEGATQGFDIVTYTGTGSATTIAHSLGVAPSMIIVKRRNAGGNGNWQVLHRSANNGAGQNGYLLLNGTNAFSSFSGSWNNTAPTSSVFSVGTDVDVNGSGGTYVAYLFSEVAGFSKFGSYTGNGSADGTFVFTGFRPRWIMLKRTDTTASWLVVDTARDPENTSTNGGMRKVLAPNLSNAEDTGADICDGLSNGFKFRQGAASFNASGGTYVYACFAETPFRNALAR